jgi:hypothetical protein
MYIPPAELPQHIGKAVVVSYQPKCVWRLIGTTKNMVQLEQISPNKAIKHYTTNNTNLSLHQRKEIQK